jgi:hypothetical protein
MPETSRRAFPWNRLSAVASFSGVGLSMSNVSWPASPHRGHADNFARAGGLFDQDVFGGPADIGHQSHLVRPQFPGGRFHARQPPLRWLAVSKHLCRLRREAWPCQGIRQAPGRGLGEGWPAPASAGGSLRHAQARRVRGRRHGPGPW